MSVTDQTLSDGGVSGIQPARYGEVYDRGYQHYDGPRLGRRHAFGALIQYSIRRSLGIKKSWSAKVVPIILYIAVALVVIIPLGIEAFVPNATVLQYWDFFTFIFLIEGILVASTAPEMLCGDRRENVLSLYFSRPITRLDYLFSKLLATAILTLTVSLVPCVIYWLGRQLLVGAPLTNIKNNYDDLGRILLIGTMIALYLGAMGLMVASFTGRKSIAVAIIIVGFLMTTAIANALANAIDSDLKRYFVFISSSDMIQNLSFRLFDKLVPNESFRDGFAVWAYIAGMLATIAISCGVMYWRYVPDE
jgi:ABC-2 type transport system permease protein